MSRGRSSKVLPPITDQGSDTRAHIPKPRGSYWVNPNLNPNLGSCSTVKLIKLKPMNLCRLLDICLMWTVSSSVHSRNLKPVKTPKPMKLLGV